jgi:hypothetical protein
MIQKSDIFCDMFSMPIGNSTPQGSAIDNPIVLPVTTEEFDDLLSWIYKM